MRDVSLQQVEQLVKVLEFLTPRQRTFFVRTMNKEQMHVFEVACFNLTTNHQGLSKKQVAILKKYKRAVEVIASKNYSLTGNVEQLKQEVSLVHCCQSLVPY